MQSHITSNVPPLARVGARAGGTNTGAERVDQPTRWERTLQALAHVESHLALAFRSFLLVPAISVKRAVSRVPPSCCPPACASPLFHAARELSLLHLSSTVHTQRRTCGPKCTTLFGFRQNAQPPCFMLRGHSSFPHSSRRPHGA